MTPLAELTHHNFPNSLPEFVPANHIEAYSKLRSAYRYLGQQFSYPLLTRAEAQANVQARCRLIELSEWVLGEGEAHRRQFSGNLIGSLTEAVEKHEAAKPCRTRGRE